MKIGVAAVCFCATVALLPAMASADDSLAGRLGAIDEASKIMAECTAIANSIAGGKVPEGHARAQMLATSNAAQTDASKRVAIEQKHIDFANWITAETAKLAACGKRLIPAHRGVDADLQKMADEKIADADVQKVTDAADRYDAAKQALVTAILHLSDDKQIQAYVHQTLLDEFLK